MGLSSAASFFFQAKHKDFSFWRFCVFHRLHRHLTFNSHITVLFQSGARSWESRPEPCPIPWRTRPRWRATDAPVTTTRWKWTLPATITPNLGPFPRIVDQMVWTFFFSAKFGRKKWAKKVFLVKGKSEEEKTRLLFLDFFPSLPGGERSPERTTLLTPRDKAVLAVGGDGQLPLPEVVVETYHREAPPDRWENSCYRICLNISAWLIDWMLICSWIMCSFDWLIVGIFIDWVFDWLNDWLIVCSIVLSIDWLIDSFGLELVWNVSIYRIDKVSDPSWVV